MITSLEVNKFHLEWKKEDQKLPVRPNEGQDEDKFSCKEEKEEGLRKFTKKAR